MAPPKDRQGKHDEQSWLSPSKTKAIQLAAIVLLIAAAAWNMRNLVYPNRDAALVFPQAGYGNGYIDFIERMAPKEHDFYIYEAIRQYFPGAHLVGSSPKAISFGRHSFSGLSSQTVTAFDPNLTVEETRKMSQHAVLSRPPNGPFTAISIVASAKPEDKAVVIVLRGSDGTRFFVSGSLAPTRFARIIHGR